MNCLEENIIRFFRGHTQHSFKEYNPFSVTRGVSFGSGYSVVPDVSPSVTRLVIATSRTIGSAKKFVRITSGFGGEEFKKTLRKLCTCQQLKFSFVTIFVMFFVGRLILLELHFIYKNKLYMFLIVKAFATA
jgi:hypothetical protein